MFALALCAGLALANAKIYGIDDDTAAQIFDVLVRDFSRLLGCATTAISVKISASWLRDHFRRLQRLLK